MEKQNGDLVFLAGLIAGAVVGGVVAALLAPRSGPEIRDEIVEQGLELKNRAEEAVERAQRIASETVAKVQVTARELLGQTANAGTEGSQEVAG